MTHVLVSAIGKDRPGFVHDITQLVQQAGGNIEQQRSVRLADEYALLLLVTVSDAARSAELLQALGGLAGDALSVRARNATPGRPESYRDAIGAKVAASGADQPGILEAVTSLLLQHRINIDSMDFDTESAPMTGDPLFRMDAEVSIAPDTDIETLRQQLRELEDDFNFDILFQYPA